MNNLKDSFEDVADWCERHLEKQWDREIGMTFGAMLRAYGRLATFSSALSGEKRLVQELKLNATAQKLFLSLPTLIIDADKLRKERHKPLEPCSMRTNMTYDTGKPPQS